MISEEAEWRKDHYIELTEKREDKLRFTKEHNDKLDMLGYKRYLRDDKEVNEKYRLAKEAELQKAKETYTKLHASMELSDKKQRDALELFNTQVEESKKNLMNIEKDRQKKDEQHARTLEKVKLKCQNQFDLQSRNYGKFEEIVETQL